MTILPIPLRLVSNCVSRSLALVIASLSLGSAFGNVSSLVLLPHGQWPGFVGGPAYAIQTMGQYAYVAAGAGGLVVFDISNPGQPVRLGGYDTSGWAFGVHVAGSIAYAADDDAGLQVIDVSNPANPKWVGSYDTSGNAEGVQVVGGYAYVADGAAGLQIIDVSNPIGPRRVGGFDTSGFAWGVHVVGNRAYVADGPSGLQVIDISNPATPKRLGGFDTSGNAWSVQVTGNFACVADDSAGLQMSGYASAIRVVGSYAYVADGSAGLQVIDVSNPASPQRTGGFNTSGSASAVDLAGIHSPTRHLDDQFFSEAKHRSGPDTRVGARTGGHGKRSNLCVGSSGGDCRSPMDGGWEGHRGWHGGGSGEPSRCQPRPVFPDSCAVSSHGLESLRDFSRWRGIVSSRAKGPCFVCR
jgi:hypothetical protein